MCLLFRSLPTCAQYLKGIAYQTIEGFEVTSAKYHHALNALKH